PSIAAMGTRERLYLTNTRASKRFYLLSTRKAPVASAFRERVDLTNRMDWHNAYSYPNPIVGAKPDLTSGFAFVTQPLDTTVDVSGFDGEIHAIINKRDMDIGLVLYEMRPDGKLMELSYYLGRASYARDMSVRTLLTPGKASVIRFDRSFLFSRRVAKGSRLLLAVDVNVNPFAQVNYGTGKDVSIEDVHDAGSPLDIQWLTSSYIGIRTQAVL
ncbi:MAG: CocE/NonD family hydrolase C-terminal non-catalytic domain-containing protein, partial [Candidatus Aquilonibacter sp.]